MSTKTEKEYLAKLDAQLAHWAATDKAHKANVRKLEQLQKHELDWFDHRAYQRMIYSNGWHK
jgi:hypothetical protein